MSAALRAPTVVFAAFAFAYFFSALIRAVTATLAPVLSQELGLQAGQLGLLAGAYFLGFAALQLPLGNALDRFGPRRTLLVLLTLAVAGCIAFALASGLWTLIAARALIGAGVSACLIAPLTCYRHIFTPAAQLRANSWMLMTGSLGMVASTLPVQMLLPSLGWRGLFWGLSVMLVLAMGLVAWLTPRDVHDVRDVRDVRDVFHVQEVHVEHARADRHAHDMNVESGPPQPPAGALGYAVIVRHPLFVRLAPLGFFVYGGLLAVQSLWAGPWLTRVAGWTADGAAQGLFGINLAMLLTFFAWGALMPRLARHSITPLQLVGWGVPLPLTLMLVNVALGSAAGAWHWAAWCVSCTFVSVSQPAVGAAFPAAQAGRALSAFNLVIFAGVFCVQWGLGLLIDLLRALGWAEGSAFRAAFGVFGVCCVAAYVWFLRVPGRRPCAAPDNLR